MFNLALLLSILGGTLAAVAIAIFLLFRQSAGVFAGIPNLAIWALAIAAIGLGVFSLVNRVKR